MKHIQLYRGHPVQVPLQHGKGNEVARDIDHQPAPREAGTVLDFDRRDSEALGIGLHQLGKGGQPAQHAQRRRRREAGLARGDAQAVRFVFSQILHRRSGVVAVNEQSRRRSVAGEISGDGDAGLMHDLPQQTRGGAFQTGFLIALKTDPERSVDRQPA